MKTKQSIVIGTICLLMCGLISGCGNEGIHTSANSSQVSEKKTLDLTGVWKSPLKNKKAWIEAEIKGSEITIFFVTDNGDTKSLYWKGTFKYPKDKDSFTVKSAADKEALSHSLLASQSSDKDFTYISNEISFKLSMLGTTKTVRLHKK